MAEERKSGIEKVLKTLAIGSVMGYTVAQLFGVCIGFDDARKKTNGIEYAKRILFNANIKGGPLTRTMTVGYRAGLEAYIILNDN
ncbi:MAG: hypothetical protein AABX93_02685 [Nanoarchaeota archaeon]